MGQAAPDLRDAVEKLGAERIGHGLRASDDPDLLDFLARRDITLELCPTSNLMTGAVRTPGEYPLRKFIENGVRVTLNADDPEIFGITLSNEYEFAVIKFNRIDRKIGSLAKSKCLAGYAITLVSYINALLRLN